MKKYSSYFNKRYFPDAEQDGEELDAAPLSEDELLPESPMAQPADGFQADPMPAMPASAPGMVPRSSNPMDDDDDIIETPTVNPHVPIPAPPRPAPASPVTFNAASIYQPAAAPTQANAVPPTDTETTIISKSCVVSGEITVAGDVHLYGKVKGNLTAQGNVEVAGKVIGNVSGNDVELNHCELKGDVIAAGFVFMDKESIMIGNVHTQDITLDGKVKGDVVANRKIYVRSNAVIVGNVRASSIAIDEGAALQGQVIIATEESDNLNIEDDGVNG